MRFFVLSVACVVLGMSAGAVAHQRPNPFDVIARKYEFLDDNTKAYLCDLCKDTIEATEEWIGAEGADGLDNLVDKCVAALSKGVPIGFAQFICDTLFADNVRPIINQLNDPTFRTAEARKVCGQITACPSN
ncbi:hypothetical protein M3Y99_01600000 [Aphelenchoides fujianensis]|nr:hypothetical protein M3Y99_01600000 [Aphelenchoides fujianensis]